jgi:hypothetical protein
VGRRNRRRTDTSPSPGSFVAPRTGWYQVSFGQLPRVDAAAERTVPVKLPPWIGPADCGDPEAHLQLECGCWCDCTGTWHLAEDCP